MTTNTAFATAAALGVAVTMGMAQERGFGPPMSRLAAAIDTNHDGTISAAEIEAASSALLTLDTNKDGQLTADELAPDFGPGGRRGRGEGDADGPGRGGGAPRMSATDLIDMLMSFDRNGDGRLERSEVPERFQGLFDRADADKDGVLTKDELNTIANATMQDAGRGGPGPRGEGGRGRGPAFGDPILRVLDTDGDHALSAAEIAGAPKALLALDANHDGQLTADEYRPPFGRGGRRGGGQ